MISCILGALQLPTPPCTVVQRFRSGQLPRCCPDARLLPWSCPRQVCKAFSTCVLIALNTKFPNLLATFSLAGRMCCLSSPDAKHLPSGCYPVIFHSCADALRVRFLFNSCWLVPACDLFLASLQCVFRASSPVACDILSGWNPVALRCRVYLRAWWAPPGPRTPLPLGKLRQGDRTRRRDTPSKRAIMAHNADKGRCLGIL